MRISDWSSDVCSSDLRVNGEAWTEADSLYAQPPNARVFTARQTDDGGTVVQFGDGRTGARVPTGAGDRKRVVWGKSVSVRGDLGGRRIINKQRSRRQRVLTRREGQSVENHVKT